MKIKEKLILSAALITIGSIFNLFFTAALHGLLSRQYDTLTLVPLFQCLSGLFAQRQQLFMFFTIPFASLKAQISHEKACCVSPLICL